MCICLSCCYLFRYTLSLFWICLKQHHHTQTQIHSHRGLSRCFVATTEHFLSRHMRNLKIKSRRKGVWARKERVSFCHCFMSICSAISYAKVHIQWKSDCATTVTMKTMAQSFSKKRIAKCVHHNVKKGGATLPLLLFLAMEWVYARWIKSCSQIGMKRYNSILAFSLDEFIFRSWKKREAKSDSKNERKRKIRTVRSREALLCALVWGGDWVSIVNFKYARQSKQWATECD